MYYASKYMKLKRGYALMCRKSTNMRSKKLIKLDI